MGTARRVAPGDGQVPLALRRQGQPGALLLGSFDLACTRFSGRPAPEHPGGAPNCGDWVMVEGYSRELSSCGFWPGGGEEGPSTRTPTPSPRASPPTR
nr:DUF5996 family protein [Janibacter melonis]